MHFAKLLLLPLASLAIAAPADLEDRAAGNAKAVLKDLNTIYSKIVTLNNTLNGFTKGNPLNLFTAIKIQQQTNDIGKALQQGTKDATASANFNDAQSSKIATNVLQKLQPGTYSLLDNIVAHKPEFATAVLGFGDLSKTVRAALVTQKQQSADFGAALAAKLAGIFGQFAPVINADIAKHFDDAIKKYDSCSGALCLPNVGGLIPREEEQ